MLAVAGVANGDLVFMATRGEGWAAHEGDASCDQDGCNSTCLHGVSLPSLTEFVKGFLERVIGQPRLTSLSIQVRVVPATFKGDVSEVP